MRPAETKEYWNPIIETLPREKVQEIELKRFRELLRWAKEPPIGVVADLQFTQALDARGNPVIRVTSTQPVNEPLLTFLVEVDWGQGRLVREYSALIDAPRTVSAPLKPEIAAPVVEAPALIERPAVADTSEADTSEAVEPEAIGAETPADPQPTNESTPAPAPIEPSPKQAQAIAPRPIAASSASSAVSVPGPAVGEDYEVRRGDTLSEIAARVGGATLDQTMIALDCTPSSTNILPDRNGLLNAAETRSNPRERVLRKGPIPLYIVAPVAKNWGAKARVVGILKPALKRVALPQR